MGIIPEWVFIAGLDLASVNDLETRDRMHALDEAVTTR